MYPAYDATTQTICWLKYSNGLLYCIDYNPHIKNASFAKLIACSNNIPKIAIEQLNVPPYVFNTDSYNTALAAGKHAHHKAMLKQQEAFRRTSDLLTDDALLPQLRSPDIAYFDQLNHENGDVVFRKTQAFEKECSEHYTRWVTQQLNAILQAHVNDYVGLKNALKAYLCSHWQVIKGTSLSYTALPNHPITLLLISVAEKLAIFEGDPAISYLMPDVYTQPTAPLEQVLKTSILDESGHYLLAIHWLLEYTKQFDDTLKLINPDYSPFDDPDETHCYLTQQDIDRLFSHSNDTQVLRDAYQAFQLLQRTDDSLLAQLNDLVRLLRINSVHGIGHETNAGALIYTAIPQFMDYYRRLYPLGLSICDDKIPSLIEAFGSERHIAYVFVKQGTSAGLYFLSRYDENGDLLDIEKPDNIQALCHKNTASKYPIYMMTTNTFIDSESFRQTLSTEHPTLIRAVEEEIGRYHVYHKKIMGSGILVRWNECLPCRYHLIKPFYSRHKIFLLNYTIRLNSVVVIIMKDVCLISLMIF